MDNNEQDRTLPIANVGRIMKQILPPSAKISKEGKQVMQECVTEFLSFVTSEASDKCHKENRKTVNGDDICWALGSLGFDNYAEAIGRYLHKYRQNEREKVVNQHNKFESAKDQVNCEGSTAKTRREHENQTETSSANQSGRIQHLFSEDKGGELAIHNTSTRTLF